MHNKNNLEELKKKIFDPNDDSCFKYKKANKNHTPYKIIKYIDYEHVIIQFLDKKKYSYSVSMSCINRNGVKNPYEKSVYGKGCLGQYKKIEEKYINSLNISDKEKSIIRLRFYKYWQCMLQRCYDSNFKKRNTTYSKCKVDKKWLIYSNFLLWCCKNYYKINNEEMNLDKDLLFKNNKLYSEKTCCFIPKGINTIISNKMKNQDKFYCIRRTEHNTFKVDLVRSYLNQPRLEKNFKNLDNAIKFRNEKEEKYIRKLSEFYRKQFVKEYGQKSFNNNKFKSQEIYKSIQKLI